jgi:hypothetical protein
MRGKRVRPAKRRPASMKSGPMEYRGIEYAVVQTIENDWRCSVKRAPKDKVGKSSRRDTAIIRAKQFIDGLIKLSSNEGI